MGLNIRPLGDRVLVEPIEKEETFAGRRDDAGKRVDMDVSAGDMVLFAKYAGTEVKLDGKKLLIMKESDILGIIDEG
jgi:chaperonin GroES